MLITPEQLSEDLFDSFEIDLTAKKDLVERVIRDVSAAIEGHLDRTLLVDKHTVFPEWGRVTSSRYEFVVREYPIVQIETVGVESYKTRTLITDDPTITEVVYYGGFRRSDQVQDDMPEGLGTLAPVVSGDIQRCTVALCTYELNRALHATYGRQSHTITTGDATANITQEPSDVYARELRRIETQRNL